MTKARAAMSRPHPPLTKEFELHAAEPLRAHTANISAAVLTVDLRLSCFTSLVPHLTSELAPALPDGSVFSGARKSYVSRCVGTLDILC